MTGATRTVAILFTDIAGSTEKWASQSDAMAAALAQHDEMSSAVVSAQGALLSKHTGDGAMAAFPSVSAAVRAAVDLQRAVESTDWPTDDPLRLRIGIHVGDAELRDGDAFGSAVNRAARLMAAAHPAQIILSSAADAAARDSIQGYESIDLGPISLRGLDQPEHTFQVIAEGLERDFPELAASARADRLPSIRNEFIGRRHDLAAVARALENHRLVTLTGPGGVGKTRLALQVAHLLQASLGDAWFADLAKFRQPDLIGAGIRTGLGIPDQPGSSELEVSLEYVARRRGLLVMDNCEHVLAAAGAAAAEILKAAPGVTLLATSQERLGLADETVWPLRPLLEDDELADAVRLFSIRAEAVNPHLDLDDQMDTIRELCRELDGMPLAIELAASRCTALTPSQIRDRLSDRFRLLGRRGEGDRHASLRATVDWSYELLGRDERALFESLAIFPAGFTLDMAEELAPAAGIEMFDTLDVLASLVDKSLIVVETAPFPRYRYLDTLRGYALERAEESSRRRVGEAFADWAERLVMGLRASQIPAADREVPNIEAAIDNMMDSGDHARAQQLLIRLLNPLADHYATWQRLFIRVSTEATDPQLRIDALGHSAWASWYGNDFAAVEKANQALAEAEKYDLRPPVNGLIALALVAAQNNDPDRADDLIREATAAADEWGDTYERYGVALSSIWTHLGSGALESAVAAAQEVLDLVELLPETLRVAFGYSVASLPYRYTDPKRAVELSDRAVALGRETEQHFWLFTALAHRGFARIRLKDFPGALRDFIEAVPHGVAIGDWRLVCSVAEAISGMVARHGRPRAATVLFAAAMAERHRRKTSSGTLEDFAFRDRSMERLSEALGDDFEAAWEEGTELPDGEVYGMATLLAEELLEETEDAESQG